MEGENYVLVFSDANGNPKYVNFYFSSVTEATDFAIKNHFQSYQVLSDYEFQEWRTGNASRNRSRIRSRTWINRSMKDGRS